jgi:hypothetical protein
MVIFAAFLAPVSWLVFAGIAVVGILSGIIVGVITASAFCIAGDTPVILADGSTKPLQNIMVGESLADGSIVTAKMRFLVPSTKYEPLVSIDGVVMSPEHMLFGPSAVPITAKDHPDALSAGVKRELFNLNTSNRKIPVLSSKGKLTLLDYEEIAEDDDEGIEAWKKHVFEFLNPGMPLQNENPENIEAGIDGLLTVNLKDGDWKPLAAVVCGDKIECFGGFTTVCGVVEMVVEDGAVLYNGMTAGVWAHNGVQWGSAEKVPWIPATPVKSGQKLYNLFTESGNFIVDGYLVRDFSEVGLADLSKTYSLVQKNFSKE